MILRHSILIIDDTTSFADHLARRLSAEEYQADFVGTIRDALDYLKQHEAPTFILADRVLEDAIEVRDLGRLGQAAPSSKILVYTFQPLSDEQRSTIIERGAYRVLDKNAVDQLVRDIKVLTQELEELLELSDELQAATSERSKIMAALAGNDVTVSMVDRRFHRIFPDSTHEPLGSGLCRKHCWTASFGPIMTPQKCWGCTVNDVFQTRRAIDGLFLNQVPDGSVKWIAVRSTPVFSRTGDSIIAACEAVTEVADMALAGLSLGQRLHYIAQSLIRAGFGRARIYKAISEDSFRLLAAAARSDFPNSPQSAYFEQIRQLPVDLKDCQYAQVAKEERVGCLVETWSKDGPSLVARALGLHPPYFDVPIWRDDRSLDGWLAVDFVGMDEGLRKKAISQYAKKETLAWLQEEYGREVKRALETNEGKPGHREKFAIAQRAHMGIASARSVAEATKEIQRAFEQLLPKCRVSVRRRTADSLREFDSLCWGPPAGVPASIALSNQESLAVAVVKSRFPIWISNYEDYLQTAESNGEPTGYPPEGTQSTAQIPLRFESTVFGTLSVNSPLPIQWDEDGYKQPLLALAEDIALVLRDLSLHEQLDSAMADRAAIIAYSINVSADGLWRHWAQQRLAEASAIVARIEHLLANNSGKEVGKVAQLLTDLSTVITRVHTARPVDEAKPECTVSSVFLRLREIYANRKPSPAFHGTRELPTLKVPKFILLNILMVLIDNALTAINDSGRGDYVGIDALVTDGVVEVRVSDNGPGIPPEKRGRILREPLQSGQGQGLGLLYARGAALQYGGDLTFRTSTEGTHFMIRLPIGREQGE